MNRLSEQSVAWLMQLCRQSIEYFSETKNFLPYEKLTIPKDIKDEVTQLSGGFVLLELLANEQRRGYIRGENGIFEKVEELGKLISQLSVNAAYFDAKTPRLKIYELNELKIHIVIPEERRRVVGSYSEILANLDNPEEGILLATRGRIAYDLPDFLNSRTETSEQRLRRLRLRLGIKRKDAEEMGEYYIFSVQHYVER